jgi:hypothetical protein
MIEAKHVTRSVIGAIVTVTVTVTMVRMVTATTTMMTARLK